MVRLLNKCATTQVTGDFTVLNWGADLVIKPFGASMAAQNWHSHQLFGGREE